MKAPLKKAYNQLKSLGCPVFTRADNPGFFISGEDPKSHEWLDYYGEFRGGYPWENPKIDGVLKPLHLACDWENPGCMVIFED